MAQVRFVKNIPLNATTFGLQTSVVTEPTAAVSQNQLYLTGNWFAARSGDGGATWAHVDPFTALPPAAGGFCCDQISLYEPSRNLWIWILQYAKQAGGPNAVRIAVSNSGQPGPWFYWDFGPGSFNASWAGTAWLDYPDAAVSNSHLYMTWNVFALDDTWIHALVHRIPLDGLAQGNAQGQFYLISTHGSLRLTQGARNDMFFGSHHSANPVRIFRWPDAPTGVLSYFDVSASSWNGVRPYSSPVPGGVEWLARIDSRITGAWVVGNRVGFLWTANRDSGHPQPYVKAMVVDAGSHALIAQPDIWHANQAWAYPAAAPHSDGVVGASMFLGGGGQSHPAHVVGFLNGNQWVLAVSRASTHGPTEPKWGDYLSCKAERGDWVASGYTLQGGSARQNIEPQYVHFGVQP